MSTTANGFSTANSEWRSVSKGDPCPICEKPDWCSVTGPEGAIEAVVCMRIESNNQRDNGGYLHRLRESDSVRNWSPSPSRSPRQSSSTRKEKPKGKAYVTAKEAVESLEHYQGKRSMDWIYHDIDGEPVGMILRWDKSDGKKDIRPITKHADGWRVSGMPEPRPIYDLHKLSSAERVYVVEGEKSVEAAQSIGLIATTSPQGSSSANKADWSPLAGKDVIILPDNDDPGREYADKVTTILAKMSPLAKVRIVELTELPGGKPMPKGGDIVDWIDGHGDAATPEVMAKHLQKIVDDVEVLDLSEEAGEPPEPTPSWKPFPLEALPEPLASFIPSVAKSVQVDPAMVALPALCAVAAAIGASRSIALRPDWKEPCILWGALVAPSGEGKTPAAGKVMSAARKQDSEAQEQNTILLTEYEDHRKEYEADRKTWEKQRGKGEPEPPPVEPTRPPMPRFTVSDVTVEKLAEILADSPRGAMMVRDELTGLLGGFERYSGGRGGAERSAYLSIFNAEQSQIDRKTGDRRSITIENPHLSIFGGIQPELLHNVLSSEDLASGLPARFLFAMPPSTPKKWGTPKIPDKQIEAVEVMFKSLYSIGVPVEWNPTSDGVGDLEQLALPLTREADQLFGEFYDRHSEQRYDLTGAARAAWPKLVAYCGRLALILQLVFDSDSKEVDEESVRSAIILIEWFSNEALRVYGIRGESDEDREHRELIDWIEQRGGRVTSRELSRGPRQYRKAGDADAALNQLASDGMGGWEVVPTATNQKRVFVLVTAATATHSPRTAEIDESVTVASVTGCQTQNNGHLPDDINRLFSEATEQAGSATE